MLARLTVVINLIGVLLLCGFGLIGVLATHAGVSWPAIIFGTVCSLPFFAIAWILRA
jgi:hypothetical protein